MAAQAQVMTGDMGATFTGNKTMMPSGIGSLVTYTFSWPATGSPIGTLGFEGCNNVNTADPTEEVWIDLGVGVVKNPNGTADTECVTLKQVGFQAIRPKYTRTSGGAGATLKAWVNVRGA